MKALPFVILMCAIYSIVARTLLITQVAERRTNKLLILELKAMRFFAMVWAIMHASSGDCGHEAVIGSGLFVFITIIVFLGYEICQGQNEYSPSLEPQYSDRFYGLEQNE
jgi:hypothetical protein